MYGLLHDATKPMETVVAALHQQLQRILVQSWVRQSTEWLTPLGVRRVTFEVGGNETIVVEVDESG